MSNQEGKRAAKFITLHGVTFYEQLNEAHTKSRKIKLTPKEMAVFLYLYKSTGRTVSRNEILREVWGDGYLNDLGLTQAISTLRKVFEDNPTNPKVIRTVHKKGYLLLATTPSSNPRSTRTGSLRKRFNVTQSLIIVLLLIFCVLLVATLQTKSIRMRIEKRPLQIETSSLN